jgi:tRNA-splicing endonuclease subunit Sen15
LYVHPDEQVEVLQRLKNERESKGSGAGNGKGVGMGMQELDSALKSEREWVLPSHLREKWSLRRFGEVFDAISAVPDTAEGEVVFEERQNLVGGVEGDGNGEDGLDQSGEEVNAWRTRVPKRLLLATLDDDSTVVYYIVHDGIVKPRQN